MLADMTISTVTDRQTDKKNIHRHKKNQYDLCFKHFPGKID